MGFKGCLRRIGYVQGMGFWWVMCARIGKGPEMWGEMPFFCAFFCALFCALWVGFCRDFLC